jgi:O-antigen/teichoic acid export membrane protein
VSSPEVSARPAPPAVSSAVAAEGKTAAKGAVFIGFAKIYFMISGFLQQVLLTRLVGAAEFGAFAVVNNVISIVNNTVVQATIQSVSKFTAEDDARAGAVQRAGVRMQAVLGTALALAIFVGAPWIADFEHAPHYTTYFRIAAAIPFLYALYAVFVGSANGLRRFRTQATFDVGFSTAKTILLLGLAFLWKVTGAFVGFAAAAAFILVVAARVMKLPAGPERFPTKRISAFMSAVVAYGLLLNVALNYDQPLLHHFAGQAAGEAVAAVAAGHYQALRTLALLPYQALIVVTFVIFPLVSRSTFAEDREATRIYVTQTLRYALILVGLMGIVLAARPAALLAILYKPAYGEGAAAMPILVAGECCLALLGVVCAILNAAGRTRATLSFVALTVGVGAGAATLLVPNAEVGPAMLRAAATATALGMVTGFVASMVYVRTRLGGSPPPATVARVAVGLAAGAAIAHIVPGHGKIAGLAAIILAAAAYLAVLVAGGELGAADRAKLRKILRR